LGANDIVIVIENAMISDLHGRDSGFFAPWLVAGFKAFLLEGQGRDSFPGIANLIGWQPTVSNDLAEVCRAMGAVDSSAFRAGVAAGYAQLLPSDPDFPPLAQALLELAAQVRAFEILEVLPGPLGIAPESEACDALWSLAMETSLALAAATPASVNCIGRMINSRGFRPGLAVSALFALVKCNPDHLQKHLALLMPLLDPILGGAGNDEIAEQRKPFRISIISKIYPLVSSEVFCEATFSTYGGWWWHTVMEVIAPQLMQALNAMVAYVEHCDAKKNRAPFRRNVLANDFGGLGFAPRLAA
jgi:hypothetical protein